MSARLVIYGDEVHLDVDAGVHLEVGDELAVVRGGGPRDGDTIGVATVTGFDNDLAPVLVVRLGT